MLRRFEQLLAITIITQGVAPGLLVSLSEMPLYTDMSIGLHFGHGDIQHFGISPSTRIIKLFGKQSCVFYHVRHNCTSDTSDIQI